MMGNGDFSFEMLYKEISSWRDEEMILASASDLMSYQDKAHLKLLVDRTKNLEHEWKPQAQGLANIMAFM
jgi:hypothetical protein